MGGTLPWGLVFCGIGVAIVIEILGLPILPIAIGLYLPIYLSTPIFIGGLIRWFFETVKTKRSEKEKATVIDKGILYCSGMIAGEGIVGIALAVLAVIPFKDGSISEVIDLGMPLGNTGGILIFALLLASLVFFSVRKKKS